MYNFGRGGGRAPVESFRRKATARLFAAAVILFVLVSGPTRAQAQDDDARHQHANGGGGNHHKHKPQVGADPFWDPTNGIGTGTGTNSPNGTWSTLIPAWNAVAGGTGIVSVWNNGDAAVFSAGTDATGSYTATVSGTVTASTITFEEGTVTLAGTATPVLTISGAGGITINSTINGTTTFASSLGTVVLSDNVNSAWTNNSSQDFVVASGVKIGDKGTITLGGSGSGTVSGVISQVSGSGAHQGALVKTGAGTFTLTGANTYGGSNSGTTVSAGTLLVNNTTGSGTGAGAVTVSSTGTLGGSGTISGTVTLNNSATINGGGSAGAVGTLNTGALTLNNTSILSVDMTSTTADQINVTGLVGLGTTAVLQLNISNGTTFTAGQQFVLINNDAADAITGTFSNAPTGTDIIGGYAWVVSYAGGTLGNDFVLTAVPEPSTWLGGCLALVGIICSQRRRIRSVIFG
jgi:hypothetical protein